MLSKLESFNDVEKINNEILINQCITPVTISIIKNFFENTNNIISSKEEFLRAILIYFNNCNLEIDNIKNYKKYSFVEVAELINEKESFNYYFKSGEFLLILYLLDYKKTNELFYLIDPSNDKDFPASKVADYILKNSVYNIDFLHLDKIKMDFLNSNIEVIKLGFKYLYSIIVKNKIELVDIINKIFNNNISYLGNIFNKINLLNEEDLKMQLFLIDVRFSKNGSYKQHITFSKNRNTRIVDKKRFTELAEMLGDHLIKKSIIGYSNGNISRTWVNSVLPYFGNDSGILDNVSSLCNENSGVALFFVYLSNLTKKKYFMNVALEIMHESIEWIDNIEEYSKDIVYVLFTLSKIYYITKSKPIELAINKGIFSIYKIIGEGKKDYISAKHMSIILSIYDVIDCNETKKIIMNLADISYKNINFDYKCEEILAFLIKFREITDYKKIDIAIENLLAFERNTSFNINSIEALLNRIKLKKLGYIDNLINSEINEVFNYIIKNGFNENNSTSCNQEIINIEIFEYIAEVLESDIIKNRCINTYNDIVNEIIEPAINEEICYGNKSVSLANGLAGYGYSLIIKCSDRNVLSSLLEETMCINYDVK